MSAGACVAGITMPEGDPGAVHEAAAALRRCAGGFEGAGATAASAAGSVPDWNGLASFAFRGQCGDYRSAAHAAEAACGQAAAAVARYGHALAESRRRVGELQRRGQDCLDRIDTAQRTATDASNREASSLRLAAQADFLAGADGGSLRAHFESEARQAQDERERALRTERRERDELDRLRRQADREREQVREAGRRAAAEVSSMAVDMPTVAYPGAPVTPIRGGVRPGTSVAGKAVGVAADLSGVTDAKDAVRDFAAGNIAGGLLHVAMAWPGAKPLKLGKEIGEQAVERVAKEGAEEGGRAARQTIEHFKGTLGERLAAYRDGGPTEGVADVGGRQYDLKSGYDGPSATRPNGTTPGSNWRVRSHVEAHVAALMRNDNLKEAELWINRDPCPGPTGCDAMLPLMLPPGAKLTMHLPDGATRIYEGLPDPPLKTTP